MERPTDSGSIAPMLRGPLPWVKTIKSPMDLRGNRSRRYLLLLACAVSCSATPGSGETAASDTGGSTSSSDGTAASDTGPGTTGARCIWNQAYQENYAEDSVADIVAGATGCYVLIDPFGSVEARDSIPAMHDAGNLVGCYISSGTCEDWRDDFSQMQPHCVATQWGEWAGEYFVDMPNATLETVMAARIDKMREWGCDMVEFDNMDWAFDDDLKAEYGFSASAEDAIAYNRALCDYTRSQGLACMAKNTADGAADFDGGTFESYSDEKDWWDHEHLQGYLSAGKLALIVHYGEADCDAVYDEYRASYRGDLSFICEDATQQIYRHY